MFYLRMLLVHSARQSLRSLFVVGDLFLVRNYLTVQVLNLDVLGELFPLALAPAHFIVSAMKALNFDVGTGLDLLQKLDVQGASRFVDLGQSVYVDGLQCVDLDP